MNILKAAEKAVYGDRQDNYGHPKQCWGDAAKMWSVILDTEVTAAQVGQCMICMKQAREKYRHKTDNQVDIAGYAACIERLD